MLFKNWNWLTFKYFIWHLIAKYICWWSKCTECGHPAYWHYWANDKVYCWNKDGVCSCGYHVGR